MDTKITIALFAIAMFLYMQLNSKLDSINLGIDSNTAILITLRDRQKLNEANDKIALLKNNMKALENTECKKCHVLNENLLLPIDNKKISYETFYSIVREGGLYMPSFNTEAISESKLQRIYMRLYMKANKMIKILTLCKALSC
ncbi:hypothetical protein [Helicobacter bilis]|uniref:Cytochrome C n=2 Tax=Helicobacter bilis TaxID=37372 RepID=A0A6D2C7Y4_9HELI|nr:hypothetical protein [Helicobacter bilis]EMZ36587.1 hypothetical protein C826_02391 [Helicobacter bilis WiWa]TLE02616.1 hypothetical protein LS77_009980 [Helicobacter bilis]TLE03692.1 hypothetical protein LS76_010050 [Helicobacter bilis]